LGFSAPDLSLYVITDSEVSRGRSHIEVVEKALAGGATCIQLRDKKSSVRELFLIARDLRDITRENNVTFIVNDRLDIALAVGADGVHLGEDDLPLYAARYIMPEEAFLGASPDTLQQAIDAERAGASYLGVGPVFYTSTKPDAGMPLGLNNFSKICRSVSIPVVGIGGIDESNAAEVINAGAAGVAVISGVVGAEDVKEAARRLKSKIELARGEGGVSG